jgi:hypothetical protein
MNASNLRTLHAIFAHPLQHGIRIHDVEALFSSLGATVHPLEHHRFKINWSSGEFIWIALGHHPSRTELDGDAVMAVRRFLESAGHTPQQPEAPTSPPLGDHGTYLVLHLTHHSTEAFYSKGLGTEHFTLKPFGLWSTHQSLHNRRERDLSGQKAPFDFDYLHLLVQAIQDSDAVLLLGHGHGESDMRQILLKYLANHHPGLLDRILDKTTLNAHTVTLAQLLAIAADHLGQHPSRHLPVQH